MWPSGSSSSALTTSEWYDGLYRPVGGSTNYVSWIGQGENNTHFHKMYPSLQHFQKREDFFFLSEFDLQELLHENKRAALHLFPLNY